MKIEIKLFSHLKYRLGNEKIVIEVSDQCTARDIRSRIFEIGENSVLGIPFRVAVNGNFVDDDYLIKSEDELALIPPVQGG